jgi:hypothetical protein
MYGAHHYCAAVNFVCFVIFSATILGIVTFPGGGHGALRWVRRALASARVLAWGRLTDREGIAAAAG